jgi:tetratricopeptide (TPR) repeat protein
VGDEQAPEAEAALREALATLPGHAPASDLLEDLLLHQGRFADLVAHHRDALASATGDAALLILEALADVQSVWAPDPAGLVVTLRELVARVPDRPGPALRLADALHETGDLAGEVAVRVALADAGPPDAELAVDQRLLAAERCEEGLADPKAAAAHLARVIEAVPQHPEARVRLELLLRRTGDAAGLAAFYQAELDRSLSDEEGTRRALQLARVLERDLGQPAEAAAVFDRLRDRDPTSAPALAALMRLRVSLGEIDRLPPVLDALAELAGEPADRAAFHQLLGELHEDLRHDDAAAEESYLRAYASDPGSPETLAVLEDLALRRADWAKLAELLEEHLRGDVSPTARRRLLSELAWILEAPLENPLRASEHWMNLATCDPPSPAAFWAGVRAAVGRREWGEATGNLEWLAGLARRAGDAALAVALETRAAVFGMVGGMPPGPRLLKLLATEGAGEALVVLAADLAPDHGADAAARLARRAGLTPEAGAELALPVALLWLREGNAPAAAEALAGARTGAVTDLPVLAALALAARAGGDRGLEADALERLADHLTDGPAAVGLYRRAAELWPGGEQAARAMRKALDRDPEDRELLERFTKALGDLGRHAEAAQVLGYRLGRLHADAEEVAMRLQRAGLRREHLGDLVGAARDYQAVLKLDPDHPEALWELARLLAADGDLEGAEPLLRRRLQLSAVTREEAAFRATCWLLVEVLERGGQPVGEALDVVDAVLAVLPGDLDALEWKHAVLLRARDFGGAVGALTERYRNVSDPKERARGEIRKAKLHRDLAANDEEARHALERARELDPTNPEVLLELVDLYRRFGDAGGVANVVGGALDSYREEMGRAAELSETTLRFLADLMERGKQRDLHFFALGALEGLGGATPEEKAKAARYRSEVTDTRPGKLTPDLWSQYLLHPLALGTTTAMFEILGEASYRLWPESLDRYGVGKGNRLTAKSAGGVTKEIFDLADALGIGLEEIYRGGSRPDEIHAVGTEDGAVLVVGDQVGPRLDARGRHQVGRLLASIRLGTLAIPRTSDEDLAVLLTAAVREVNPDFRGDVPESRMEELGKKARKAMSRKDRKALPLVAMSFGQEPLDLPRWRRGLERTCHRVGLICSGDLAASMASLKAAETSAVVAQEALRDLVIFALSTAHADVRKTLGLTR